MNLANCRMDGFLRRSIAETVTPCSVFRIRVSSSIMSESTPSSLIPVSANYTIAFLEENQVSILADCNVVQGTYAYDGTNLTIQMGASTMAYCGENSLDNLFLTLLSQTGTYEKQGGRLNLISASETITMGFKDGGAVE